MSATALIVRVAQAEARVRSLRDRFHPVARLGVPAHITVLFPFMAAEQVTDDVLRTLRAALSGCVAFDFTLASVGRFELTAYLVPQPAEPFIQMTNALVQAFPEYPPFGGEFETVIPHLTVAHGNAADAELAGAEMAGALLVDGPIHASCSSIELLKNSSGRWEVMQVFSLPNGRQRGRRSLSPTLADPADPSPLNPNIRPTR